MQVDESKYEHKQIWKRRLRTAPSAPPSDKQIHLFVLWNCIGQKHLPSKADLKDPILWSVWQFGSGMVFKVVEVANGKHTMYGYFADRKAAIEQYRKLVKDFPRSKEIDYGFPCDDTGA